MMADIPSAYLVIIAHPWGAYSHQVWDFARFAFNFDTLAPAPNSYGDVEKGKGGRTIAVTLGGYSESLRWLVKQPFLDH
ncbi:MAG TPA: hypothetical protein VHZ32_01915, partial [Rhizomicrobium sp.]|nr:hypothetical protein [Rhizomicrobium sp.]